MRFFHHIVIIFLSHFSISSYCSEQVTAVLTIDDNQKRVLSQGDIYTFKLVVHPVDDFIIEKEVWEHKVLLNFLYVTKVLTASASPNNKDAYVVKFEAVIANGANDKSPPVLNVKDLRIPVKFDFPNIENTIKVDGKFALIAYERTSRSHWLFITLMLMIVIFLMAFLIYRKYFLNKKEKSPLGILKDEIKNYNDREQIECLYRNRDVVNSFLTDYHAYFEQINKSQYSPDWSDGAYKKFLDKKNEILEALRDFP